MKTWSRGFIGLATSELITVSGSMATFVALPWFVLQATGSPGRIGLVMAADVAGMALSGLFAGWLIQRVGYRRCMISAECARGGAICAIPMLDAFGILSIGLVASLMLLVGLFYSPFVAAQRVAVPRVLGRADAGSLSAGNAVLQGCQRVGTVVGPALAGLLIATTSPLTALWIDGASFFLSAVIIWTTVPSPEYRDSGRSGGSLGRAVRELMSSRQTVAVVGGLAVGSVAFQGIFVTLPVLVAVEYDRGGSAVAIILGVFGGGAAIGAVISRPLFAKYSSNLLAGISIGVQVLMLWPLAWVPQLEVCLLIFFVLGLGNPLAVGPVFALLTVNASEELRGHVMSATVTLLTCMGVAGLISAGQLLERFSVALVFGLIALVSSIGNGIVAALFLHSWSLERRARADAVGESGATG